MNYYQAFWRNVIILRGYNHMKIYETDGHCSNFDAEVLSCNINKDGLFDVILSLKIWG